MVLMMSYPLRGIFVFFASKSSIKIFCVGSGGAMERDEAKYKMRIYPVCVLVNVGV